MAAVFDPSRHTATDPARYGNRTARTREYSHQPSSLWLDRTADRPAAPRSRGVNTSLRVKRSNPGCSKGRMDCFVACAPRNDARSYRMAFRVSTSRALVEAVASAAPFSPISRPSTNAMVFKLGDVALTCDRPRFCRRMLRQEVQRD